MIYHKIPLPEGFGYSAVIYIPGRGDKWPSYAHYAVGSGTHSYDSEGAMLCWNSGFSCAHACDMEYLERSGGLYTILRESFGELRPDIFRWRWVVTEVLAKINDTPIVFWTRDHGLSPYLELDQVHQIEGARIFLTQKCNRAMAFGIEEVE